MKFDLLQLPRILILLLCQLALVARTEEPFTIAVIPDTQSMVHFAPHYWRQQCQWIVDNQSVRKIKAAIHVGDLVEAALNPGDWTNAMAGLEILKSANIPIILAPGNHDLDWGTLSQQMTNLSQYIPPAWFASNSNWNGGFYDEETLKGSYLLVSNEPSSYLIVALAHVPDEQTVNWARAVTEQYSNCPAIFVTHCYVDDSSWGRRASWTEPHSNERYFGDLGKWWTPNRLWADWISHSRSIFWVISGHLSDENNTMYFSEPADDGHLITQSLCDYQNTSAGWMQLLTVTPDENECHIETFSTRTGQVRTNWNEDYTFPLWSTNQTHFSKWQLAQAAVTNGLILWNGFDRTNQFGFVGLSPYGITLTGRVAVAEGGIYVNCYPAFSNMVQTAEFDPLTGLTNITVSLWYKATNSSPAPLGILAGKFVGGTAGEWYLATVGPSTLRWVLVNTNDVRINLDLRTPTVIADGDWHHVVSTYDGTNARIYFDGIRLGALPFSGRLKGTSYPVSFGGLFRQGSSTSSQFTPWGWLDRVKIWNRALSAEEVNKTYVKDFSMLHSARVENIPNEPSTGVSVDTSQNSQYVLRFAVAANPSIAAEQRMTVSWDKNPVADLSFIQTQISDKTNWVYTSVIVNSSNLTALIEPRAVIGEGPHTDPASTNGPLLADITVTPFFPPLLDYAANQDESQFDVLLDTHPGIAYRLQASLDLDIWNPASRWVVATGNRMLLKVNSSVSVQRFFRVEVGF